MAELIVLYHQSDFDTPLVASREEVYRERNTKYRDYFVAYVDIFVFRSDGRLIVQRRSKDRKVSPGLLHTTAGGHVNPGTTF